MHQVALERRNQTIKVEMAHAPEKVYADRDMLSLALANLVSNAIKYTPDGSTVTLRVLENADNALCRAGYRHWHR